MALAYVSRLLSMAKARGSPRVLAVAAAGERACLEAVAVAREEGLVEPLLYGDGPVIEQILRELDRRPGDYQIFHHADVVEAARRAAAALAGGQAQIIMKGLMYTADLLRVYLDKSFGLRSQARPISHVGLFEVPAYGRPFAVTDAAINVAPDDERLFHVLANAVSFMRRLGWRSPRAALVAATNRVQENQPASVHAARVAARAGREIPDAVVAGPLALDEAMSPEAARTKSISGPVAGNADIIVVPNLECGNAIYKTLTMFAHAKVVGACVGGRAPIVMTSRADTEETKLLSMALACCLVDDQP